MSSWKNFTKKERTGIQPIFKPASIASVYPNPANSGYVMVEFQFKENSPVKISFTDLLGREVYSKTILNSDNKLKTLLSLNLTESHIRPGVYVVNISNGTENFRQKLVVE